jgi:hypothetical protein
MCDCYITECEGCGAKTSIHIADFCTSRSNVHPYCIPCARKIAKLHRIHIKKGKKTKWPEEINGQKVFLDKEATLIKQGRPASDGEAYCTGGGDQEAVILCDDHSAYGVHFN